MSKQVRSNWQDVDQAVLSVLEQTINLLMQNKRTKEQLQAFNEGRNPFELSANTAAQATLEEALRILGDNKVVSAKQWAKAWDQKVPGDMPIRYTTERLQQAVKENNGGKADWRLVYLGGLSLVRQRELRGADRGDLTKFDVDTICWLDKENEYWQTQGQDSYWAEQGFEAGYHLVNVKGIFGGEWNWHTKEDAISRLEDKERCFEEVFSEIILTIGLVIGEEICRDWVHWGRSVSRDGHLVYVYLYYDGVYVNGFPAGDSFPYLRVALFWNA